MLLKVKVKGLSKGQIVLNQSWLKTCANVIDDAKVGVKVKVVFCCFPRYMLKKVNLKLCRECRGDDICNSMDSLLVWHCQIDVSLKLIIPNDSGNLLVTYILR